ncbi:hypothetical protein C491_14547 [Natronococcus amylolyticus DSM 10524]|uniref:DUF4870 domain-containing protein n=1 Tax=Natronococcus amylolyticus DSM 10524 TaxID=1227497 RepID=L9X373_9EURY|nr:hypothetical protein [Natronococcus amylolyticus]ELY56175.1 hypothetical protein C491_14547 [Natronococcus amylolyticus DSM 10524]
MSTDNTEIDGELGTDHSNAITTEPESSDTEPIVSDSAVDAEDSTVVGGLSENIAGALVYLFAPFIAVLFYLLEDRNEFVRFHAAQSIVVFGGFFAVGMGVFMMGFVLEFLPFVGWMLSLAISMLTFLVLAPLGFILWVLLTYKAVTGERYALPVAGEIAERYV